MHGVYDLGAGGFSHLELTDKHGGEALDRGAGVEGERQMREARKKGKQLDPRGLLIRS